MKIDFFRKELELNFRDKIFLKKKKKKKKDKKDILTLIFFFIFLQNV